MAFCLSKDLTAKFKEAIRNGEINIAKMVEMDSEQRRKFLTKYVGENASQVNALFESKLLLKNQVSGMKNWVKKVSGLSKQAKMDLLSRIERMDERILNPEENEQFLQDLAKAKLKIGVTREEAQNIFDLSQKAKALREKANEDGVFPTETDRLAYGANQVAIENYINDLKSSANKTNIVKELPGTFKSLVASLDNSFFGRQGIKVLYTKPNVWLKAFLKSWGDIKSELKGQDAIDVIKADIYSRPNALNGKYKAGNYQLDVLSEEAFPSSLPSKLATVGKNGEIVKTITSPIRLLGRLYNASESAYNGAALRMRADLADIFIDLAENNGVNMLDKSQAEGLGHFIGSMTGRGSLNMTADQQKNINLLLFSIKFMKSNIDTLTAHQFDKKATPFVKKQARKALLRIAGTVAATLTMVNIFDPDAVDEDPRSQNFGKIKIFGNWIDITGGMASLVTLASRLIPTKHNGEWGLWKKSGTGNWTNLLAGQYGQEDAYDLIINGLFSNKLSPVAGILRDVYRGEMFGGKKFNLKDAVMNLITPLSIQNFQDLKDNPDSSFILGSVILEGLGFSTSTNFYKTDWNRSTSKEMKQFKKEVGKDKFQQANDDFNRAYSNWYSIAKQSEEFKGLSDEGKKDLISKAKQQIKEQIFEEYDFSYEKEEETDQQKEEKDTIKELIRKTTNLFKVKEALAAGKLPYIEKKAKQALRDRIMGKDWVMGSMPSEEMLNEYAKLEQEYLTGKLQYRLPEIGKVEKKRKATIDIINRNADKYGVPRSLATDIAYAESNLDPTNSAKKGGLNSSAEGVYMFTDATWSDLKRYGVIPQDAKKTNAEYNIRGAMYFISEGYLSKWDASKNEGRKWGQYYSEEELSKFYKK